MQSVRAWVQVLTLGGLGVAAMLTPARGHAYCRATTCEDSKSQECPRDAQGCKVEGTALFWPSACVGYSLNTGGTWQLSLSSIAKIAEASFGAWADVSCTEGSATTLTFARLGDVACHRAEINLREPNANILLFQDRHWRFQGLENTIAKTTTNYDRETGEILDADIEVNSAFNAFGVGNTIGTEDFDLQSILTHEIGHFIGLDHSTDTTATMYFATDTGLTYQRDLAVDDVAALCAAYSPERDATCEARPYRGWASECGGDSPVEGDKEMADDPEKSGCSLGSRGTLLAHSRPRARVGWVFFYALACLFYRQGGRRGRACF